MRLRGWSAWRSEPTGVVGDEFDLLGGRFILEVGENGIEVLDLSEAATLQLPKLPALHRDPFDRMLVCQAVAHGLTLVTPDTAVRSYPIRTLW